MMASYLWFLIISLLSLLFIPGTEQIQSTQTQLVLQLRRQLEYPQQLEVWNYTDNVCYTPASQNVSVTCDGDFVTELKIMGDKIGKLGTFDGYAIPGKTLSQNFVVDSFVTTLTRLTSLKVVILVALGIWGPLPDKIHRLGSLEVLDLSSNFLYGSIPPKISVMTRLQTLCMDGNYLNDTVPNWFSSFSNLTVLSFQENSLRGPLPGSVSGIPTLTVLALSGNNISGKIPDISNLKNLEMLDLRGNKLDSEIPSMPNDIVTILLSNNSLSGEIPQQFVKLSRLQHLDLSYNLLKGAPPAGLFALANLSYLNLASNMLSGSLPSVISCSSQLGFVDLSANRLTGELPACLSSHSNKRVVKVDGNCLSVESEHQHAAEYCQASEVAVTAESSKSSRNIGLMVAVIGGVTLVVLLLLLVFLIICRRNCKQALSEQHLLPKSVADNSTTGISTELLANARYISQTMKLGPQVLPSYRVFSLEELKEATNNFEPSAFIGEGPKGKIYKGRLENGSFVAIRCLAFFKRYSIRNLKLRLDMLSKLRHPHLVCLLGHCIDSVSDDSGVNRVFLVYECVTHGNFHARISERSYEQAFKWSDRLAVLIGVAKAVHFLHTGIIPGIFNNRLKSTNILFDENLVAKVSDYGLSIISEEIYKHEVSVEDQKNIQCRSHLMEMLNLNDDISSLGFILIEALTGSLLHEKGAEYCTSELAMLSSREAEQQEILDPIILASASQESLSILISITNKCLSRESSRPSIEDVLWNLQYAAQVQATADGDYRSEVASQA